MASQKQQAEPLQASEATVTELLKRYFEDAEDVVGIFLTNHGSYFGVRIITDHKTYSSEAMDVLLDREFALRDEIDGTMLEIDYIPQLGETKESLLPFNSSIVFWRD